MILSLPISSLWRAYQVSLPLPHHVSGMKIFCSVHYLQSLPRKAKPEWQKQCWNLLRKLQKNSWSGSLSAETPNPEVKALPSVTGTRRKRRASYLKR